MYIIAKHWGGQSLYIVKVDCFLADDRDIQIYSEFNGHNHAELAQKYDLSTIYIYRIVKRMGDLEKARKQPDLFETWKRKFHRFLISTDEKLFQNSSQVIPSNPKKSHNYLKILYYLYY